jgi:hypothetical protein
MTFYHGLFSYTVSFSKQQEGIVNIDMLEMLDVSLDWHKNILEL